MHATVPPKSNTSRKEAPPHLANPTEFALTNTVFNSVALGLAKHAEIGCFFQRLNEMQVPRQYSLQNACLLILETVDTHICQSW